MATGDLSGNVNVVSQPFVFVHGGAGSVEKVRIYDCPAGKKLKLAKVWIHTANEAITFYRGNNATTTALTAQISQADIRVTTPASCGGAFDENQPHYEVLIGGSDGEDFMVRGTSDSQSIVLSAKIYYEDA